MGSSATERNIVVEKNLKVSFIKDIISFDISLDISFAPYLEHLLANSEVQSSWVSKLLYPTWNKKFFLLFNLVSLSTGNIYALNKGNFEALKGWTDEVLCKTIPMGWNSGYTKNELTNRVKLISLDTNF